jgi:hypothetical protein
MTHLLACRQDIASNHVDQLGLADALRVVAGAVLGTELVGHDIGAAGRHQTA